MTNRFKKIIILMPALIHLTLTAIIIVSKRRMAKTKVKPVKKLTQFQRQIRHSSEHSDAGFLKQRSFSDA
jgi:hypothetical protein